MLGPVGGRRERLDAGQLWGARLALASILLMLAWRLVVYLQTAARAVAFPFELDYGEGIVWQQMRLILNGQGYGPIDGFPAIVFHYPPVFHALSGGLAAAGSIDELAAGRLLSVLSTLITVALAALLVMRLSHKETGRAGSLICGAIAGLSLLSWWPVVVWSNLMRVDMVALAFSLAGLTFGHQALVRPKAIYAAAICFVLAVFTKQTAIAAPAAVFGVLLFLRPRVAWAGLLTAILIGLPVLVGLSWITNGGFVRHAFIYNINRFEPERLRELASPMLIHGIYLSVAACGILQWVRRVRPSYAECAGLNGVMARLASRPADAGFVMVLAYLFFATVLLAGAAKSGSSVNYFIEWSCIVALLVGLAMQDAGRAASKFKARSGSTLLTLLLPLAAVTQLLLLPSAPRYHRAQMIPAQVSELQALSAAVSEATKPVISDDMVILLRSGKEVVWESAIFAELASKGIWDERIFIEKICNREFAFFITDGIRGDYDFDDRYNPAVAAAMAAAYSSKRALAGYILHSPDPGSTWPAEASASCLVNPKPSLAP